MPPKVNIATLFRRHLGRVEAAALLDKIDEMVAKKKSAAQIESAIQADISNLITDRIADNLRSRLRRKARAAEPPIEFCVKSRAKPIAICRKLEAGVQVRVPGASGAQKR